MANLINSFFTPMQLAMDNVLKNFITEGKDNYKDGIWRMSSKFGTNNNKLIGISSSEIIANAGKLVMITNEDMECTEDVRINPLCDFGNSVFNSDKLIAWGDTRNVADTSDAKHMRKYITTYENTEADDYTNPVTYIADAGRCIGTFKNIFSTIDCKASISSGVCCYQEYNLENNQCYGFQSGIDGLTEEFEIILSNDSKHCQAKKNIRTGKITYIEETDPLYNVIPSNFGNAVVLGDYIYYIGIDNYIYKLNKTTLEQVKKSTSTYSSSNYSLFTDGTKLYMNNMSTSNSNSRYMEVGTSTLNIGNSYLDYYSTVPEFMQYNSSYPSSRCVVASIDNGSKFVLYSSTAKCAIVFTDINNIKGSILPEYTQFNVGSSESRVIAFTLTSKGLYSFWLGNTASDIGNVSGYSVKVCKNTSGQLFNLAEWETPYENSGNVQVELTLCE